MEKHIFSIGRKAAGTIRTSRLAECLFADQSEERISLARTGFLILANEAGPAIPELAKFATNENHEALAMGAGELLGCLGPPAVPALIGIVTNTSNILFRSIAIGSLGRLGTNAQTAIPILMQYTNDSSSATATFARDALSEIDPETFHHFRRF